MLDCVELDSIKHKDYRKPYISIFVLMEPRHTTLYSLYSLFITMLTFQSKSIEFLIVSLTDIRPSYGVGAPILFILSFIFVLLVHFRSPFPMHICHIDNEIEANTIKFYSWRHPRFSNGQQGEEKRTSMWYELDLFAIIIDSINLSTVLTKFIESM